MSRNRLILSMLAMTACSRAASSPSTPPQSIVVAAAPSSPTLDVPEPDPPVSPSPAPCPTTCKGDAPAALVTILVEISQQDARKCYEQALRRDRSLRGRMRVDFVVQSNGRICGVSIVNDEIGDTELDECIKNVYSERNVPEPSGGCAVIHAPLNMTPKDADAGP